MTSEIGYESFAFGLVTKNYTMFYEWPMAKFSMNETSLKVTFELKRQKKISYKDGEKILIHLDHW